MRHRAMGVLMLVSGVLFVAAVVNPPILPYWGDDTAPRSSSPRPAAARGPARCGEMYLELRPLLLVSDEGKTRFLPAVG